MPPAMLFSTTRMGRATGLSDTGASLLPTTRRGVVPLAARMSDESSSCTACALFDDHAGNAASQPDVGLRRFNPPVSQPSADAHGLWPVVSSGDRCGHFAPERSGAA